MAQLMASSAPNPIMRINRFRGLNVSVDPTQIAYNESPDMLNMLLDTEGALDKRTGYKRLFPVSLGPGKINGMYTYRKQDGSAVRLLHHGTKLYTFKLTGEQPVEIYDQMANNRSQAFTMTNKLFILDGSHYLEFDGTAVIPVVPYIPTLNISVPPFGVAGGGQSYEQFNLIGTAFEESFSPDGTAKDFLLSLPNLDATPIVASTDSGITYDKVEGADFTVDRMIGLVTWLTAPEKGTNTVKIRAHKTVEGMADMIRKCWGFKLYGGTNDTRVFLWGSDKNTLYRSDVYRPHYFPENQFQRVGDDSEKIHGMAVQYDTAVVIKERSMWGLNYHNDGEKITFPVRPINDQVGCIAPYSVAIVDNNPVSFTKNGLYVLSGGAVRDERNVSPQSRRVDRLLLHESNLENAASIDFDKKYYLALNGNVYAWDYSQPQQDPTQWGEWYLWDNIPVSVFLESERSLYFGSSEEGLVYRFCKPDDNDAYMDDGKKIRAYWRSKLESFGASERHKTVNRLFFSIKPSAKTSADLYYVDETDIPVHLNTTNMTQFSYAYWDYTRFSYITSTKPQVTRTKVKAKKIIYFQVLIENDYPDESLGLLSVEVEHVFNNFVK